MTHSLVKCLTLQPRGLLCLDPLSGEDSKIHERSISTILLSTVMHSPQDTLVSRRMVLLLLLTASTASNVEAGNTRMTSPIATVLRPLYSSNRAHEPRRINNFVVFNAHPKSSLSSPSDDPSEDQNVQRKTLFRDQVVLIQSTSPRPPRIAFEEFVDNVTPNMSFFTPVNYNDFTVRTRENTLATDTIRKSEENELVSYQTTTRLLRTESKKSHRQPKLMYRFRPISNGKVFTYKPIRFPTTT